MLIMSVTNTKKKQRRPSRPVTVSPVTEWTDHTGINELFGLRRSTAIHVFNTEPELKGASISLKGPNESRGKRLFNVRRFRAFLKSKQNATS
jgi:hypothetical protein